MSKLNVTIFSLISVVAFSSSVFAKPKVQIPHLDLEMSGAEYEAIGADQKVGLSDFAFDELQYILTAGKRNLDWLMFINNQRPAGSKISFSSAATQVGIPMDAPRVYNPQLIRSA